MPRTVPARSDDRAVVAVSVDAARLVIGIGGFAIVIADIVGIGRATGSIDWGNYFGQFTILGVMFASVVMVVAAIRRREPPVWVHLRAMALTAVAVAGIVHALLLGGAAGPSGPIVNALLHIVFPVFVLIEWVGVRSPRRVSWFTPLFGLVFPSLFLAATLVRGVFVDWYPYSFIDPTGPDGYVGLVSSLSTVLVAFLVVGIVVTLLGAVRDRRRR